MNLVREMPFFSILIPISGPSHLLTQTLETIRLQNVQCFEILLLAKEEPERLKKAIKGYEDLGIQLLCFKVKDLASLVNEGGKVARGQYLHCLFPGDRFLSQQGLSCIEELIVSDPEKIDVVYSGFLTQDANAMPHVIFPALNLQNLKEGAFPADLSSLWILKETWLHAGGLSQAFRERGALDLLCRLLQNKGLKTACSRRVLTERPIEERSLREIFRYVSETCQILTKYFGSRQAAFWVFRQTRLRGWPWLSSQIKQAFFKRTDC